MKLEQAAAKLFRALQVIRLTQKTREWLEANDPKSLQQLNDAAFDYRKACGGHDTPRVIQSSEELRRIGMGIQEISIYVQTQAPAGNWVDSIGTSDILRAFEHADYLQGHGKTVRVVRRIDAVMTKV